MGEDAFLPDRGPPARSALVHESDRTRVTRLWFSGCTVIRKEPLGSDAQRRLQHEMAILHALRLKIADSGLGGAEFTGGTGVLGLKDRAEALGGHLDLHSPEGAGTTLRITLPLAQR